MSQLKLIRIDGHKLIFHPRRVVQWLDGNTIYPVYLEISPSGACNHRCTFCALDYMGYRQRYLDVDSLIVRLYELGSLGIASIMYGGEGEPLLHPEIARIIEQTKSSGIDVAMSTNGVYLVPELARQIIPYMSWIKVSINAGSPDVYASIHRTKPDDFRTVIANMESAARFIKENNLSCTLGAQIVLLPENAGEIVSLAEQLKNAGLHYLVIKPYSQHLKSHTRKYAGTDYSPFLELQERLSGFNDCNFSVIFRMNTIMKLQQIERGYERCLALPFWSYIATDGNVWACSAHIGDDRFLCGNIHEQTFQDIWSGEKRLRLSEYVASELNPESCRRNCRMDEINRYLWELINPSDHVNFI
jgi:radical SAM protein with 4Fe4S-binding SPASM domain